MEWYIGYIEKFNRNEGVYYFYPMAELNDKSGIHKLTADELANLLPKQKERKRILLMYHRYPMNKDEMNFYFDGGSLAVCSFYSTDLDKYYSEKYGYTLPAIEYIKSGKIKFIHSKNIFHVVGNERWLDDFLNKGTDKFYLNEFNEIPQKILCGEKIFMQADDDFFVGPCTVEREDSTGLLYVTPLFQDSKYILSGCHKSSFDEFNLSNARYKQQAGKIFLLKNNERVTKDFITTEDLLDDFKINFVDTAKFDGDKEAIHSLVDRYAKSIFWGIPADVQSERLRRLESALLDAEHVADEFKNIHDAVNKVSAVNIGALETTKLQLMREIDAYTKRNAELYAANKKLESDIDALINSAQSNLAKIAFDGFLANKLVDAAANFAVDDEAAQYKKIVAKVAAISAQDKNSDALADYLCEMVHAVRPAYDRNTILNLAICLTQGFLTVFYGAPGCGKTSICNIFAEILGLNKISELVDDSRAARYIPVSVEKGWTSKRDFTGYYNPLTKVFDKNNRRVYDALRLLDIERGDGKFPCVILLDEANLSPMEHYWSDFMNICDGVDANSHVNLGADNVFAIPETLRFVATINNDHTTENLSPRLIDRAWLVSLPSHDINFEIGNGQLPKDKIEIVTWKSLRDAFTPSDDDYKNFPTTLYKKIIEIFAEQNFSVSPRIHNAVKNYCAVAAKYFSNNAALDFAVAQRILPKIIGNGENFQNWLGTLEKFFDANAMKISAQTVHGIIERGKNQIDYYSFFL